MIKFSRALFILFIFLFTFSSTVHAEFEVPPGGIAIIGFNFDGTTDFPQEFSFVCTTAIPAGTEIRFTDNGWLSTGSFRTGEGVFSWYTPGGCSVGQVVNLKQSFWSPSAEDFILSTSGDQILVYQFLSQTNHFIFALNSRGTGWQPTASDAFSSALPTGLDNTNSIALLEIDNAIYTGSKSFTSVSEGLASIVNTTNWSGSDTVRQTMPTGTFSFGTTAVQVSSLTAQTKSPYIPFAIFSVFILLFLTGFLLRKVFIRKPISS